MLMELACSLGMAFGPLITGGLSLLLPHRSLLIPPALTSVLSLLFFVVWILLMPIKCCCPGGCIVGCLECIFEKAVKLPVNIANWALS